MKGKDSAIRFGSQVNIFFQTKNSLRYFLSCEDFLTTHASFKNIGVFAREDFQQTLFTIVPNFSYKALRILNQYMDQSSAHESGHKSGGSHSEVCISNIQRSQGQQAFRKYDKEVQESKQLIEKVKGNDLKFGELFQL
jgi:hypothetical protein